MYDLLAHLLLRIALNERSKVQKHPDGRIDCLAAALLFKKSVKYLHRLM